AMRNGVLEVAPVERFDPDDGSGVARPPLYAARSDGHAVDRHLVLERLAGNFVLEPAGAIPDLDVLGEFAVLMQVREGAMDGGDEQVPAIGGDVRGFDDGRLAQGRDLAGFEVDGGELGGRVVFPEGLVV